MSHWKKNWTRLVSALFRKFGSCFGLFEIEDQTQYMYIVGKYNKHSCLLQNMTEMLPKDSLFYLSLKIVQINYIFFNNICIFIYVWKVNPTVLELDFWDDNFFCSPSMGFKLTPLIQSLGKMHMSSAPRPLGHIRYIYIQLNLVISNLDKLLTWMTQNKHWVCL